MSKRALIVVDVQNDFISGSLSLSACPSGHDGAEIVPIINRLVRGNHFDLVVFTQDWHPKDHISFVDNVHLRTFRHACACPKKKPDEVRAFDKVTFHVDSSSSPRDQVLWPRHCVQDSPGAQFHPDLEIPADAVVVKKGEDPDVDSYSAFWDNSKLKSTRLASVLRETGCDSTWVCGIATDVCVKATALDALELGFDVFLIVDACRGVDEEAIRKTLEEIKAGGGKIVEAAGVVERLS